MLNYSTTVWPQVNNREGTQPRPSTENWIKDLLSTAPPIRTRPSFPLSQSLPLGSFNKPHPSPSEGRQTENHNHRKLTNLIKWTTALSNSMKLWAMMCRATQDGWVMVESSDKTWSTGEGNGKPLQYSGLENPMNSMKRQKDRTLKDELPRLVVPNMLLEISGDLTPERMKRWSQSKNNTQLWMWLVMEVKFDSLRAILHSNLEC